MTEDPTFILFYTIRKKDYMQNLSRMGWNVAFHYPRKISKNIFLLRSQKHSRIIIQLDTAAQVYQKVQEYIETEKETLDVKELQGLLKECGAKEERLKRIEEFPEQLSLHTQNIIDDKKYVIEGSGVKVQVNADSMDVLEYKQIDGRSYLCIPVDVGLKKDGLSLR